LEAAKRRALLKQYAYVEEDEDTSEGDRDRNAPPRMLSAAENEEKRKAEERRRMIEEALRLDGRKKKYKKQQDGMFQHILGDHGRALTITQLICLHLI